MFRIGARAAILISGGTVIAGLSIIPAVADFNHRFPGKGSENAWHASWQIARQAGAAETKGDYKSAEALFRKAIHVYPYDALSYYNLAVLLDEHNRLKEAEPLLRKSIDLQPTFRNWDELGIGLAKQGRLHDAENAFVEASRLAKTPQERQDLQQDRAALDEELAKRTSNGHEQH